MRIGGLQKFSLLDYPGELSAIIFTQGCNFRCKYCYNPMLVCPDQGGQSEYKNTETERGHSLIEEDGLFNFLNKRIKKLDAVVITGGEPTMHNDLPEFLLKIRKLGFKIKLDTNGTSPEMIKELIDKKLIDYIAMDIKNQHKKYKSTVGVEVNLENVQKSIIIIKESGLPYEFRTTIVPKLIKLKDIKEMGKMIKGADKWYLQQFKHDSDMIDNDFKKIKPYMEEELDKMQKIASQYVKECKIRN